MSKPLYQLWLYNDWANQLLFDGFSSQEEVIPASCMHLLCHMTNAQSIWVSRITGSEPVVSVWQDHSLADCEKFHKMSSDALSQIMEEENDGQQIIVSYTNTKNESYRNSRLDILLHIFNHATYHRAQIATAMRNSGLEPINTDYITYARMQDASG